MEGPPLKRVKREGDDNDNPNPVTQCVVLMIVASPSECSRLYIIEQHKCPASAWACLCNKPLSGRIITQKEDWEGSEGDLSCRKFLYDAIILGEEDTASSAVAPRCSAFYQVEDGELPLQIVAAHSLYESKN